MKAKWGILGTVEVSSDEVPGGICYKVNVIDETCSCPKRTNCKHIQFAKEWVQEQKEKKEAKEKEPTKSDPTTKSTKEAKVTQNGYDFYEVLSAFQKALRRGEEEAAMFWALELHESKQEWMLWQRLAICVAEDVGMASIETVNLVANLRRLYLDGCKETTLIGLAVIAICRAPKNRLGDDIAEYVSYKRKHGKRFEIPPEALDSHTRRGARLLSQEARNRGISYQEVAMECFYTKSAKLKGYKRLPGIDWSEKSANLWGVPADFEFD